jgi:phosphocarrier protein FPr
MELSILSPLDGPIVPLEQVPDPVFAQRLAGDGIALDPLSNEVLAPCDAIICQVHRKSHAVTLSTPLGAELLIHVGVDTVELNGTGFTPLVVAGQKVRQGERILKFDAEQLAVQAKSLVTSVLVVNQDAFSVVYPARGFAQAGSTPLFKVVPVTETNPLTEHPTSSVVSSAPIVIIAENGLHARPAALLVEQSRRFVSQINVVAPDGRRKSKLAIIQSYCWKSLRLRQLLLSVGAGR